MAELRISLADINTELLRIVGNYSSNDKAPWGTAAKLYLIINAWSARLPANVAKIAAANGMPIKGKFRFDMYRTSGSMTTSSGSQTATFPTDYDHWISFYDETNAHPVHPIRDVSRWHKDLKTQSASSDTEYIEIYDFGTPSSSSVRTATLWPQVTTGVTPNITVEYWRLPAKLAGSTPSSEYPDADPRFHPLWIYGPAAEVLGPNDPSYALYKGKEDALLMELATTARAI